MSQQDDCAAGLHIILKLLCSLPQEATSLHRLQEWISNFLELSGLLSSLSLWFFDFGCGHRVFLDLV